MSSFAEVTTWPIDDRGVGRGEVPTSWMQGRTSYGGVVAAIGLRGLRAVLEQPRVPRTVHASFIGPVGPGPAELRPQVLRSGRYLTHGRAEIWQGEQMRAQVTATFADDRPSSLQVPATEPGPVPEPETLVDMPYVEGLTPAFTQHVAMRWADGGMPFSGGKDPRISGWCRHRTDPGSSYEAVLGLLDTWPAPVLPLLRAPAPSSSVSWTTTFLSVPESFDPEGWWRYDSETTMAAHGYAAMRASLRAPDGRLAAVGEQLVAVFDGPKPSR
ncbi:MAG: thioesterase family protein [Myxococcota bacterium]